MRDYRHLGPIIHLFQEQSDYLIKLFSIKYVAEILYIYLYRKEAAEDQV